MKAIRFLEYTRFAAAACAVFTLPGCTSKNSPGVHKDDGKVVRLAYFPNVTHAAALVGTARGTFKAVLGPDVTLEEKTFAAGPAEIEAVYAGAIDIGYIGPGPAVNGYIKSEGEALTIIAGASSGGAGLVARTGVPISRVADLAGKHVAIPQVGGTQDISLRHALQTAGLTPTSRGGTVNVLQYAPADIETKMKQGEIDAAWLPEPWISRLEKAGIATLVRDERDDWPDRRFATTVVIVRTDFLKEHADLVRKFLAAHRESVQFLQKEPDAARKIVGDQIAKITKKALPDDVLKSALSRTDFTDDPLKESVLTFADWARSLGYLRKDRSALVDLIDTSLQSPPATTKTAEK